MSDGIAKERWSFRLRLPLEGPLLGWTRLTNDEKAVQIQIFATPDDSNSDPAACLIVSYLDQSKVRQFVSLPRNRHPHDQDLRAPYFSETVEIPVGAFVNGSILLEVLALHAFSPGGGIFALPPDRFSVRPVSGSTLSFMEQPKTVAGGAPEAGTFDYTELRATLEQRLKDELALLEAPDPESDPISGSHSFERRGDRTLGEAQVSVRLPSSDRFKFVATTCRYPGFAFESGRVDAVSFKKIAAEHADASGMLLLGDQIYADATASLFDKLTSVEKFRERYYSLFRSGGFATAARLIPCYMTGDDHEFREAWSKPDDALEKTLLNAARTSFSVYQISHSPFQGKLNDPHFDHGFVSGPVGVYVMDTLSNRDTRTPGKELIVSQEQLDAFSDWLKNETSKFIILATGAVIAPGMSSALDENGTTDMHRAQGLDNWQMFNDQRVKLFDIIAAHSGDKQFLLVAGDYHCYAEATLTNGVGTRIARAVVAPPAYAPMRFLNTPTCSLARTEKVDQAGNYQIALDDMADGSGFVTIEVANGGWVIKPLQEKVTGS